jgi:hypothetical protein
MLDKAQTVPFAWRRDVACDAEGTLLSFASYVDSLIADGWRLIGIGGFAHVLERDEVVLKVCRRDAAYVRYMEHVCSSPSNRAHPRIVDVVELTGAGEPFHRVVIERLDNFQAHLKRGDVTLEEIRGVAYRMAVAEAMVRGSAELSARDRYVLEAMTPDERVALDGIIKIAHEHGFSTDLEAWNVMLRDGSDLVFTDPLLPKDYHELVALNDVDKPKAK